MQRSMSDEVLVRFEFKTFFLPRLFTDEYDNRKRLSVSSSFRTTV